MENKEASIFSFKENLTKTPSEVDSSFTRHRAFYVLLLNIASTYVISTILSFIILAICSFFHLNDNIANSISQLVSTIVTLGLIIPLMYKTIASDAKVFSKKTWLVLLLTLGFFVIFYVLVSYLYTDLIEKNIIQLLVKHNIISSDTLKKFPTSINQIEIEKMLKDNTALIISIPSIVVLAPFLEELIYRKSLFRILNIKVPGFNAIISGLIFGLVHVIMPIILVLLSLNIEGSDYTIDNLYLESIYFFNYFICGVLLGIIYNISGQNLFISYLVHLLNNLIVLIDVIL